MCSRNRMVQEKDCPREDGEGGKQESGTILWAKGVMGEGGKQESGTILWAKGVMGEGGEHRGIRGEGDTEGYEINRSAEMVVSPTFQ